MIFKKKLDFYYFYEIYRKCSVDIIKLEKKYPDDNSKYWNIARYMEENVLDICIEIFLEEILPTELEKDSFFYERCFFEAIEKEESCMLFILSLILHNNAIYHKYVSLECRYKLMHDCLDILRKNGTDMIGNNQIAMVYENILILGYTHDMKGYDKPYHLCKKLFALEETDSWKGCNISRMYYETFGGLMGEGIGKREFDLLVDFYHKTTLTFIKEEYLKHHLEAYFLQEGLCDEHFNWIGKS